MVEDFEKKLQCAWKQVVFAVFHQDLKSYYYRPTSCFIFLSEGLGHDCGSAHLVIMSTDCIKLVVSEVVLYWLLVMLFVFYVIFSASGLRFGLLLKALVPASTCLILLRVRCLYFSDPWFILASDVLALMV